MERLERRSEYSDDHPEENRRRLGAQGDPAEQDDFPDFHNGFWNDEHEHETQVPHDVEVLIGFDSTLGYPGEGPDMFGNEHLRLVERPPKFFWKPR